MIKVFEDEYFASFKEATFTEATQLAIERHCDYLKTYSIRGGTSAYGEIEADENGLLQAVDVAIKQNKIAIDRESLSKYTVETCPRPPINTGG